MKLIGSGNQNVDTPMYDASGTITAGGTPQLVLPHAMSRSSLLIENISDTNMYVEVGGARATATVVNGSVTAVTVTNVGFGYTYPPIVRFYGGGYTGNNSNNILNLSATLPDYAAPVDPAQATAVLTGSAGARTVASITIDNPGSGYSRAPFVFLESDPRDPMGAAAPSATSGILLLANGGSWTPNGTICTTDAISIFCASSGKAFTCKFTV